MDPRTHPLPKYPIFTKSLCSASVHIDSYFIMQHSAKQRDAAHANVKRERKRDKAEKRQKRAVDAERESARTAGGARRSGLGGRKELQSKPRQRAGPQGWLLAGVAAGWGTRRRLLRGVGTGRRSWRRSGRAAPGVKAK